MWVSPLLATSEYVTKRASQRNKTLYELANAHGYLIKSADTPALSYSLAGRLVVSSSGWGLLEVPNAIVNGLFDALHEPGIELPPGPKDSKQLNAHISVFTKDETDKIGRDKISERGHFFHYTLGPMRVVKPAGWDEMALCWFVELKSPELEKLRKSYGLTPLPKGDHPFHITVAVRRKHVLKDNDVVKHSSIVNDTYGFSTCPEAMEDAEGTDDPMKNVAEQDDTVTPEPVAEQGPTTPYSKAADSGWDPITGRLELEAQLAEKKALSTPTQVAAGVTGLVGGYGLRDMLYPNVDRSKLVKIEDHDHKRQVELNRKARTIANALERRGAWANTYHKRVAIPKAYLSQQDLADSGYLPSLMAIPESGQDQWTSYRHPDNLYHFHSHGDVWTAHKDEHPSMAMLKYKEMTPFERIKATGSGIQHVLNEGVPGAYAYLRNALTREPAKPGVSAMTSSILRENDKAVVRGDLLKPKPAPVPAPLPEIEKQAVRHHAKVVEVKKRDRDDDVWICPHCNQEILEKSLYRDAKGWWFHRPCFLKGKGSILLPDKVEKTSAAQWQLWKKAYSGALGSAAESGQSATIAPAVLEGDGSTPAGGDGRPTQAAVDDYLKEPDTSEFDVDMIKGAIADLLGDDATSDEDTEPMNVDGIETIRRGGASQPVYQDSSSSSAGGQVFRSSGAGQPRPAASAGFSAPLAPDTTGDSSSTPMYGPRAHLNA